MSYRGRLHGKAPGEKLSSRKKAPGQKPELGSGIPESDLVVYLEVARVALGDADIFDSMAEKLDIADEEMIKLRDRLQKLLGGNTNG